VITVILLPMTSTISIDAPYRSSTKIARACALLSGVTGLVAGLLLVGDFALDNPYDPTPSGPTWLGAANDVVGIVQFAAFAPVVWALRRRLPTTRSVRVSTVAAVAAAIAYVVLSILLVAGVMTFQQQIGLLIVMIVVIYMWLLIANLAAHRFRTLRRSVTLFGVMVGVGLLVGSGAGWCQPGRSQPCRPDHRMARLYPRLPGVAWPAGLLLAAGRQGFHR
jgi:hypothetical protein